MKELLKQKLKVMERCRFKVRTRLPKEESPPKGSPMRNVAQPTKSKVEFGCMGKDGFFDDLKIWNAAPVK